MATDTPRQGHSESDPTSASTLANYAQAGFCARMGWGSRPALLLVDVCKAYWASGSPLDLTCSSLSTNDSSSSRAGDVLLSIRRVLAAARGGGSAGTGVPVIWTAVEYERDGGMRDAGLFFSKAKALEVFRAGDERGLGGWIDDDDDDAVGEVSDEGDLRSRRLRPEQARGESVIRKKYASGFFGTTLASELARLGVDTVVIVGVSTSGCVRATALDAMQHGYRPMVVDSACGDRTREIHDANMFDLNAKYADVVTEEEAIEHLNAGWS